MIEPTYLILVNRSVLLLFIISSGFLFSSGVSGIILIGGGFSLVWLSCDYVSSSPRLSPPFDLSLKSYSL